MQCLPPCDGCASRERRRSGTARADRLSRLSRRAADFASHADRNKRCGCGAADAGTHRIHLAAHAAHGAGGSAARAGQGQRRVIRRIALRSRGGAATSGCADAARRYTVLRRHVRRRGAITGREPQQRRDANVLESMGHRSMLTIYRRRDNGRPRPKPRALQRKSRTRFATRGRRSALRSQRALPAPSETSAKRRGRARAAEISLRGLVRSRRVT